MATEAANKAKLEQLQFLCHEIRNPLNGILGNISFMQDTEIDEEQVCHNTPTAAAACMGCGGVEVYLWDAIESWCSRAGARSSCGRRNLNPEP